MTEATPAPKHELDRQWSIWMSKKERDQKNTNETWGSGLRKIFEFDTVEDFWRFSLAIRPIGELPDGTDVYCFISEKEPSWEKVNGGEWRFIQERKEGLNQHEVNSNHIWMQSCLSSIGEVFTHSEGVYGVAVNFRRHQAKFFLWTGPVDDEQAKSIGAELRKILGARLSPGTKLEYYSHKELLASAKAQPKFTA